MFCLLIKQTVDWVIPAQRSRGVYQTGGQMTDADIGKIQISLSLMVPWLQELVFVIQRKWKNACQRGTFVRRMEINSGILSSKDWTERSLEAPEPSESPEEESDSHSDTLLPGCRRPCISRQAWMCLVLLQLRLSWLVCVALVSHPFMNSVS